MITTAVDVKAVVVVVVVTGVYLGASVALLVVGLLGVGINLLDDAQDIGIIVIGSLDSVPERQ